MDRWATFDCYGTLIDWNAGIRGELGRIFGEDRLADYHQLEPEVQRERSGATYREVMAEVMRRLGAPEAEQDALGRSLPRWPVFPEVPAALAEARGRGWRLAALSNTDPDLLAASLETIGVPFDATVTASEIGSYKPAHGHWSAFFRRTGADPARHVHVAQSHFHDVVPAVELGLRIVWINRLGESVEPAPTRELPDLARLADTLDELVPA
ncbi:MAG TPA: HAD-IA family hydrolase [Gaiellaceae bacterium]|nr:HAD-IA family hydrolase [Gaiellaceae bacterium]